jgi:hypothetical protein
MPIYYMENNLQHIKENQNITFLLLKIKLNKSYTKLYLILSKFIVICVTYFIKK